MKKYSLRFIFHGHKDQVFVVTKKEADRLALCLLDSHNNSGMFLLSSRNGLSVAINLNFVQGVRFLWDVDFGAINKAAATSTKEKMSVGISICLHGKDELLEVESDDYDQVYDFFINLEYPLNIIRYVNFDDEDGEAIFLNKKEIVWLSVPSSMIKKGESMVLMQESR